MHLFKCVEKNNLLPCQRTRTKSKKGENNSYLKQTICSNICHESWLTPNRSTLSRDRVTKKLHIGSPFIWDFENSRYGQNIVLALYLSTVFLSIPQINYHLRLKFGENTSSISKNLCVHQMCCDFTRLICPQWIECVVSGHIYHHHNHVSLPPMLEPTGTSHIKQTLCVSCTGIETHYLGGNKDHKPRV